MKLTSKQKYLIRRSLQLNEDFYDDETTNIEITEIEEKTLNDCNYVISLSLPFTKPFVRSHYLTQTLIELNNHTSINHNKNNIFDGLVLWNYDTDYNLFEFGFDSIKEEYKDESLDTFKYILDYLTNEFSFYTITISQNDEVIYGKFIAPSDDMKDDKDTLLLWLNVHIANRVF